MDDFHYPATHHDGWTFTVDKLIQPGALGFDPTFSTTNAPASVAEVFQSLKTEPAWLSPSISGTLPETVRPGEILSHPSTFPGYESVDPVQAVVTRGGKAIGRKPGSHATTTSPPADINPRSKRLKVLAKNREAANRYRLRQKDYVKNLERRCQREAEKRRLQNSLLQSLQQEVAHLQQELFKQSSCQCRYIRAFMQSKIQTASLPGQ